MSAGGLDDYRRKRDFGRTPEPDGEAAAPAAGPLRFVVHKHAASRLHYDLRLELDAVLKCWSLPKGPSARPGERRFAARTEDHPLEYAAFEGVIPEGQYGAGPSLVWDAGTFSPDEKGRTFWDDRGRAEEELRREIAAGKVSVTLRGRKLKGSWALVRMKGEDGQWLMLKHRDPAASEDGDIIADGTSVASGRSIEELRSGMPAGYLAGRTWDFSPPALPGALAGSLTPVEPMLATARTIPQTPGFSFEPKLDGIRVIAYLDHGRVELRSRGGHDITAAYPSVAASLRQQPAATAILDGEIVAVGPNGRPSFELLQHRMNLHGAEAVAAAEREIPVVFFVFDVVHLDGYQLFRVPLCDRREVLARLLIPTRQVLQVATIPLPQDEAFETAVAAGFEGIIAKRDDSRYEPGRRSAAWLKRKALNRDVFVVAGWTAGEGHRSNSFGGLIIGERGEGGLAYRGKVGSGFNDEDVDAIRRELDSVSRPDSPFGVPTPDDRVAHWVEPRLHILVEYASRTSAGVLRTPVFKGIVGDARGMVPAHREEQLDSAGAGVLGQLERLRGGGTIEGPGWTVPVTNLDKLLWPPHEGRAGFTKRDLLRYATRMFPFIERHIANRPLTLLRFPDGIERQRFYQKHWEGELPPFVETVTVYSEGEAIDQQQLLCNNLPTLLWLCQVADLEWHATLSRILPGPDGSRLPSTFAGSSAALEASVLNYPEFMLFDLDPYIYAGNERAGEEPQPNEAAFARTAEVALSLKEILDSLGLVAFVKTSGATGLHVFVPLKREFDFGVVRAAANTICLELLSRRPKDVTMEWATNRRIGKVFLDANQNARHKNLAVAYSPRAKPGGPVSMPIRWDQVGATSPRDFTMETVPGLVATHGDPWWSIYEAKQSLSALLGV
jgi:bifunctional non-homologous end joining protein LigD